MPTQTVTNTNPLWDLQAQYLPHTFDQAKSIYESGAPQYYPGETVAGFDPVRAQGLNMGLQAAGQQQNLADAYTNNLLGFATGNAPAQQNLAQQAAAASNLGAFGTGTLGGARASQGANQAAANAIASNQLSALQQIPQAQTAALAPSQTYGSAGRTLQDYNQQLIDSDVARFNYNQNLPFNWLSNYQTALGFPGGAQPSSTQVTSSQPSGFEKASGIISLLGGIGKLGGIF